MAKALSRVPVAAFAAAATLGGLAGLFAVAPAHALTWQAPVTISEVGKGATNPEVTVNSEDNTIAVWGAAVPRPTR